MADRERGPAASSTALDKRSHVVILALGGTIAGVGAEATDTHTYTPGVRTIESILEDVPELKHIAHIKPKQVQNEGSPNLKFEDIIELVREVRRARKEGAVGVVVVYGTDTLVEMVFLLALLVGLGIVVAAVGAIRPITAHGSDGLHHLVCGVRLVVHPQARNRGVMVVFNDWILSAWYVVKRYAHFPNAFDSGKQGDLGCFVDSRPMFYGKPCSPMNKCEFDFDRLFPEDPERTIKGEYCRKAPQVRILSCHMDVSADEIKDAVNKGVKGIVLTGLGAGRWPTEVGNVIKRIKEQRKDEVIFVASRQPEGYVKDGMFGLGKDCIPSGFFDPSRSRLLLKLCLHARYEEFEIRKMFDSEHDGLGPACSDGCGCFNKKLRA